jgi:uncharacterized membrane protein
MKRTKIIYWISTAILALMMLFSGVTHVLNLPDAIELIKTHLGYPGYFIPFLGVAKILGAVALLVPRYPRLKEWAYAGFVYDFLGAVYSLISVGDPVSNWLPVVIFLILLAISYIFYHRMRREASVKSKVI